MTKVFITGVARGLGSALMKEFVRLGWVTYGTVRTKADLEEMKAVYSSPNRFFVADVTDVAAMKHTIDIDVPDIVIANAGVINKPAPLWDQSEADWQQALDVNVMGVVNTAKSFLPGMIKANTGLFIAVSSGWGRQAVAALAPYCASKFAVEGLIESLNHDLKNISSSVRAIALDPGGGIHTDMLEKCLPEEFNNYQSPDKWAKGAVSFILEDLYVGDKFGSCTIPYD